MQLVNSITFSMAIACMDHFMRNGNPFDSCISNGIKRNNYCNRKAYADGVEEGRYKTIARHARSRISALVTGLPPALDGRCFCCLNVCVFKDMDACELL